MSMRSGKFLWKETFRARNTGLYLQLSRFKPMHSIAFSLLLIVLACLTGCAVSKTSADLSKVQGNWRFDEPGYLESLRAEHKNPEELKKIVGLYEFGKKNGTPEMTDITISGSRITTDHGLLRQQYDLFDCRTEGGRIVAKAIWHEDLNDPGDATTIDVVLQTDGASLSFTVSDEGLADTYTFRRE